MQPTRFPQNVIERLGYYVYLYKDPATGTVFYVGKGRGNRAFAHLKHEYECRKVSRIRKIRKRGEEPVVEILVHGLKDEAAALRIEAAVIDLLGVKALTNEVRGYESSTVGRVGARELIALYKSEPVEVVDPAILIRVNQRYRYEMADGELYEITRGVWSLGERRSGARFAFAVFKGVVREVYEVHSWHPAGTTPYRTRSRADVRAPGRWEFVGRVARNAVRHRYIDKSVERYFSAHAQNPFTYVNC